MKTHLLKLISELSGKINPPMWTVFVYAFFIALKEGKTYDEAKAIGQAEVDNVTKQIGNDPYVQDSVSDYSLIGAPLVPNFGKQVVKQKRFLTKIML